ncbi:MAG: 30S ribosome-binding factor RbfA [Acidimicrobiales bacterium]|nr:30S ribosome-binding factor RbfA [Acidimicrobiales bacterium]MCB9372063.1 30S ribosome-binding factor RbfA [Microthrixaceae bacterium]
MARRRTHQRHRDYPRTARLNELFREIVAEALDRVDDDRLELVTVTSVDVDADLKRATVYVTALDRDADEDTLEALTELRPRLQGAVAREARVKRTPELVFRIDDVLRTAERIDELLRENPPPDQ